MRVPLVDVSADLANYPLVTHAVRDGTFVGGSHVVGFEDEWAQYAGAHDCVTLASGTDALSLVLRAWYADRPERKFVLVPATSFVATVEAVLVNGLTPLVCDVTSSGLLNVERAVAILNSEEYAGRVLAAVPVHLYGQVVDVDLLREGIQDDGVEILEDACQAHGARYPDTEGTPVGSKNVTAWSFMPAKILGCWGDGGAVTFPEQHQHLADRVRSLANHGRVDGGHTVHGMPGFNSRLDNIQAAVLRNNLHALSGKNTARGVRARWYDQELPLWIRVQLPMDNRVWNYYACWVEDKETRDALVSFLHARDVGVGMHYPYTLADAFTHLPWNVAGPIIPQGDIPVARRLADTTLTLPLWPEMRAEQHVHVVKSLREFEKRV